ncbi:MAG: twin-arginine translocase subunit TatC [Rickettsiales bacterium]|nr:twin-arginine translocase subunit TatC [Rickettsiales bacterium]
MHLIELRRRLMVSVVIMLFAFGVSYYYADVIYNFLITPLADIYEGQSKRMIYTGLTEVFFTYIKISFYSALFISFPVIAGQIYLFMKPGLYKHERKYIWPFLVASPILFMLGASLVYFAIMPLAWNFLIGFETSLTETVMPIELEAKVSDYLSLVLQLIFAFGFAFQMPIILVLLAHSGIISAQWLRRKRKYALVCIVIMAAILTPPDIISQIGLALPLLILYEVSILVCKFLNPKNDNNS